MVEHTLHILVLPGLHPHVHPASPQVVSSSESMMSLLLPDPASIRYQHPNLSFWPPSPFHLKLPIITRLAFNDAGKITHHRDFWDVKVSTGYIGRLNGLGRAPDHTVHAHARDSQELC